MDTDQLLAFQRVVREGSFSRAARTLDIGQPAVSARIQALEAQLGDLPKIERQSALVRRSKRGPLSVEARAFIENLRQQATALGLLSRARERSRAGAAGRAVAAGTRRALVGTPHAR